MIPGPRRPECARSAPCREARRPVSRTALLALLCSLASCGLFNREEVTTREYILRDTPLEEGSAVVLAVIKKSGVESRLMEFFPANNQQQTEENFR